MVITVEQSRAQSHHSLAVMKARSESKKSDLSKQLSTTGAMVAKLAKMRLHDIPLVNHWHYDPTFLAYSHVNDLISGKSVQRVMHSMDAARVSSGLYAKNKHPFTDNKLEISERTLEIAVQRHLVKEVRTNELFLFGSSKGTAVKFGGAFGIPPRSMAVFRVSLDGRLHESMSTSVGTYLQSQGLNFEFSYSVISDGYQPSNEYRASFDASDDEESPELHSVNMGLHSFSCDEGYWDIQGPSGSFPISVVLNLVIVNMTNDIINVDGDSTLFSIKST